MTPASDDSRRQRRALTIALALNALMFVVGLAAGLLARSSGLIADSLDMLADAAAYAIALAAITRGDAFRSRAAAFNGAMLLLLGAGVLIDSIRRGLLGDRPDTRVMIVVATVSLMVNATVLRLLHRQRNQGIHLRATWVFTRADVIANLAVIASGIIILTTGFRLADAIIGAAIGLYIVKEAVELLRHSRRGPAGAQSSHSAHPGKR